jgi:hypothetical protein
MAHDEEQEGHSAVKQKPADSLKTSKAPIYGWWRPAWNLSFEGRVGNVAPRSQRRRDRLLSLVYLACITISPAPPRAAELHPDKPFRFVIHDAMRARAPSAQAGPPPSSLDPYLYRRLPTVL